MDGKVALVTGGSRGLGRQMVLALAAEGADVIIASRKLAACEQTAAEVEEKYGRRALPVACNVSDWDQCDALVEAAHSEFGRIDILINNAGLSPIYPSLDQVGESLFDKVIGVNVKGPFRLAVAVGTRMAAGRGGSIINVSSVTAIRPDAESLPYAMAKAALNTLTEGLAQAFAPSVRVNTIQCGPFRTDIASHWTPETVDLLNSRVALGRCGEASEIVGAALYFASELSSFCTGATLRLDGGFK
jgi:NAD(P)-dependent dehydrogenase (short-subunit alcohol dehydrogenase family)